MDRLRTRRQGDAGFTLIELLVVMIIIGILAAIAIPAMLTQKRKARETSAKSDVKQIVHEVQTYYVDGKSALTLSAGAVAGTWQLVDSGAAVVATGQLSSGNSVSALSVITSDSSYCVAVVPSLAGAKTWRANQTGLAAGNC